MRAGESSFKSPDLEENVFVRANRGALKKTSVQEELLSVKGIAHPASLIQVESAAIERDEFAKAPWLQRSKFELGENNVSLGKMR